jgi:hypothetical protein
MLALERAARWTRGQCEGIFKGTPVDVLIASAEDSPSHTLIPRLKAAEADLARVHIIKLKAGDDDAGGLRLPDDVPLLAEEIRRVEAKILIIDPLMSHLGEGVNANKDQHIRKALGPLPALAEAEDLTILIICHLNKNEAASTKYRIGGSVGIFAVPRSVLLAAEHPENDGEYVLVHITCNVGEKAMALRYVMERKLIEDDKGASIETGGIVWRGEAEGVTATSALSGRKDADTPSICDEVKTWLEDYLGDGPCAQKAVIAQAKLLGYREKTVRRAREALGIKPKKEGFGKDSEWTWKLPSKDAQPPSKDAYVHGGGHLRHLSKNIGENNHLNQIIPKGAPPPCDGHLSNHLGHLSESKAVEAGNPVRGEDDGYELFPNPDEVNPWN